VRSIDSSSGATTLIGQNVWSNNPLSGGGARIITDKPNSSGGVTRTTSNILKETSLGTLDTKTGTYYNSDGTPVRTLTAQPTKTSLFLQDLSNKNPVMSAIDWGLYSARKPLANLENKYTSNSQSLFGGETGERTQSLLTAGLFMVPVLGSALAVGAGTAQFTTPGGVKEIKDAPSLGEKALIVGQATAGMGFGSMALRADISRMLVGRNLNNAKTLFTTIVKPGVNGATDNIGTIAVTKIGDKKYYNLLYEKGKTIGSQSGSIGIGTIAVKKPAIYNLVTGKLTREWDFFPYLSKGYGKQIGKVTTKAKIKGLVASKDTGMTGLFSKSGARFKDELISTNLVGSVKTEGKISYFSGSDKAKLRIYKQGGVKYAYGRGDINVLGKIIRSDSPAQPSAFGFIQKTSSGGAPNLINVQKTAQNQVSSAINTAKGLYKASSTQKTISGLIRGGVVASGSQQVVRSVSNLSPLSILNKQNNQNKSISVMSLPSITQSNNSSTKTISGLGGITLVGSGTSQRTPQTPAEGIGQVTPQMPSLRNPTPQTPQIPRVGVPGFSFPGEIPPVMPVADFGFKRKKDKSSMGSYSAYALVDSTKSSQARWIPLVQNVDRMTAKSIGGAFVDESNLSSQFRIDRSNKPAQNTQKLKGWSLIAYKFRDYMQTKGTKISMQNKYIERQRYRLDSTTEKRNIQSARNIGIANRFMRKKR
jgi:hypothetical protein